MVLPSCKISISSPSPSHIYPTLRAYRHCILFHGSSRYRGHHYQQGLGTPAATTGHACPPLYPEPACSLQCVCPSTDATSSLFSSSSFAVVLPTAATHRQPSHTPSHSCELTSEPLRTHSKSSLLSVSTWMRIPSRSGRDLGHRTPTLPRYIYAPCRTRPFCYQSFFFFFF